MGNQLLHNSKIKSQNGFTIVEILIVVALSSIMMLANVSFLNEFLTNMHKVENESFDEAEMAIVGRRFSSIMAKMSPTFNRINTTDDNGKSFFDYYPDMPRSAFGGGGARQITMSASSAHTQVIYFLMSEDDKFPGISMDPVHAYNEGITPADLELDGLVVYKGINSVPDVGGSKKLMTQVFGNRWGANELFVLSSPIYLRPVAANGTVNLMTVPRMPSYVGKVVSDDLQPLTLTGLSVINTHPATGIAYANADTFFRTLPALGGASPFVKVEPVRLIRMEYRASPNYPAGYGDIFLSKWVGGSFIEEEIVIRKCMQIRLKRDTVTMPLVNLEIDR